MRENDQLRADKLYKMVLCCKYYEVLTAKRNLNENVLRINLTCSHLALKSRRLP